MREVDFVVALCKWTRDLLVLNGVPAGKIILSRQAVSAELFHERPKTGAASCLRIAFLGRMAPEKGLPILIEALRAIPTADVSLDIYGEPPLDFNATTVTNDQRISFRGLLARQDLLGTLQNHDVVAVPSQWLETGPMVVMEAFAAGVPVIGSRLGGIAELVRHGVDGLLIEPASVRDWAAAINDLAADRSLLSRLRAGVVRQRTTREAATEIEEVYAQVVPQYRRAIAVAR
jgi:glycosyltransferase involved in cell wall biosynthesis